MKKTVLFLCTGNSVRSQMAEGWLRRLGGDRFEALSAGIRPKGVNPRAVQVMAEAGVDISGQRSKDIGEFLGRDLDLVVTLCGKARETCPAFRGKVKERRHWAIEDPAIQVGSEDDLLGFFRRIRDEIRARVEGLVRGGVGAAE